MKKQHEDLSFLIKGTQSVSFFESRKSYNELYKKFKGGVANYVSKYTSDEEFIQDIVSESFAKAFSNMVMYKKQKAQFSTWIYSIARNTTIDWIRKGWINTNKQYEGTTLLFGELIDNFGTDYSNPMDKINLKVFLKQVETEIEVSQNKNVKNVFQLYIDGLQYAEISKKTKLPVGSVKAYIHRVKTHLKAKFTSYQEELIPSFS